MPPEVKQKPQRSSASRWFWLLLLIVAVVAGAYFLWPRFRSAVQPPAAPATAAAQKGRNLGGIPVIAAKIRKGDIPVFFTGIANVIPIYTVQVQSRVTGELMKVYFKEGDLVHKGDPLVEIDPRPYQAALTQAEGQLIRDQALLANARVDQARYKTLLAQNAIPEQELATQDALVKQDEGTVELDQGMIDAAKVNLVYCHIQAPIAGRIGLRLVDPGNVVQAATPNTTPLLVITQIDPISVIFTLNEDYLPVVIQKLNAGQQLRVDAYDRSSAAFLAHGTLTTVDNQIDPTTGTLRLRATFDNKANKLFPNQFVNVRLLVQLKQGVTLAPTATIQRNTQNTYVFLVKPDSTVTVRNVNIGTVEGTDSEITSGLQPGDTVVMTGVDKLTEGTKVVAHLARDNGEGGGSGAGSPVSGTPTGSGAGSGGKRGNSGGKAHKVS